MEKRTVFSLCVCVCVCLYLYCAVCNVWDRSIFMSCGKTSNYRRKVNLPLFLKEFLQKNLYFVAGMCIPCFVAK